MGNRVWSSQRLRPQLRLRVGSAVLLGVCAYFYAATAWGAQATLAADAHVNSAMPATNSGAISNLNVGGGYTALLQFDLSQLPVGTTSAQVSRAVLRVYANRVTTPGQVTISSVTGTWGEYSVTFATEPAVGSSVGTFPVSQAEAFVAVDVTSLVQGWINNPATNNGLALSAGTAMVQFDSKENDQTAHAATLDVELVDAGPAGVAGANGTVGIAGANGAAGATGLAGATGSAGSTGLTGAVGATGPNGLVGIQGLTGAAGQAGSTGAQGSTGAAGQQGPIGPAGTIGAQGLQGIMGQAGAQGIPGVTGATGLSGPLGPQGVAGPVGLAFQGAYSSGGNYALADGVSYKGAGYVSLTASNHGNTPDQSPQQWALFAAAGAGGATGPAGLTGATGSVGAAGPQGLSGSTGSTGATGPQGPLGLNGGQGLAGPTGSTGAIGIDFRGAWLAGMGYTANDAVTFGGSTYLAEAGNSSSEPDLYPQAWTMLAQAGGAGPSGPIGVSGAVATITIGTVTTGAAGTQVVVTNAGTSSAAVLNFTIPQGAAGSGGGSGASGISFLSTYHMVSYGSIFYSVNGPASSVNELAPAPVLTWVPTSCTATTLSVFSQQNNPITVTLRAGGSASMADTVLSCTAVPNNRCTATGNVSIAAGSFVDLRVAGSDGNPAAVWTALACN